MIYFPRLGGTKHLPVFGGRASEGVRRYGRSPLEMVGSDLHSWEEKGQPMLFSGWTHIFLTPSLLPASLIQAQILE